jgi:hypothetical protein
MCFSLLYKCGAANQTFQGKVILSFMALPMGSMALLFATIVVIAMVTPSCHAVQGV